MKRFKNSNSKKFYQVKIADKLTRGRWVEFESTDRAMAEQVLSKLLKSDWYLKDKERYFIYIGTSNPLNSKMKRHLKQDIKGFKKIEAQARSMRKEDVRTLSKKNSHGIPTSRHPKPGKMPVEIYGKTSRIEMQKTSGQYKGQHFYHNFSIKPSQYGIPSGTILKFPDGRTFKVTTRSVLISGKKDIWKHFQQ